MVCAGLVGFGLKAWAPEQVSVGLSLQIWGLGLLFGPLSSLLSYLMMVGRGRLLVRQIAARGLTAAQVLEAYPPRRAQLKARLVAFTAISVIAPALMTAQVTAALSERMIERVSAVKDVDQQRRIAEQETTRGLVDMSVLFTIVFALAMATARMGGKALGDPMREVAERAARIARGELTHDGVLPAEDEVWAVSGGFSTMQLRLSEVMARLKSAGASIGSTTEQIVATSSRYEAGASDQAQSLNATSATTEELARSAQQITQNSGQVQSIAQQTLEAARNGQTSAEAFSQSVDRIRQDNQAISDSVLKLNKRVQQIGKIVEFINGIADKSDLLALNAELEGMKAGEVGRGFSSVAAEMRRLAENVLESTKEIEGLIEEIREATHATVSAAEVGMKATERGAAQAEEVLASLGIIVDVAGRTSEAARAISFATQQQQTGTLHLSEAMVDILRITQENLGAARDVVGANSELAHLARDLRKVVERFQVN